MATGPRRACDPLRNVGRQLGAKDYFVRGRAKRQSSIPHSCLLNLLQSTGGRGAEVFTSGFPTHNGVQKFDVQATGIGVCMSSTFCFVCSSQRASLDGATTSAKWIFRSFLPTRTQSPTVVGSRVGGIAAKAGGATAVMSRSAIVGLRIV